MVVIPLSQDPTHQQSYGPHTATSSVAGSASGPLASAPMPPGGAVRRRNPLAVWPGLPLITLGIYPFIGLLLCFVFGLQPAYYQSELNKIADVVGTRAF